MNTLRYKIYTPNNILSIKKRKAKRSSNVKAFTVDSIMEQSNFSTVSPVHVSSCRFGVQYENQFVFSDDGKHVIGVDASVSTRLLVEDLTTGSSFQFGKHSHIVSTIIFDEESNTLLAGDWDGHVIQYTVDLVKKKISQIKDHGNLRIGFLISSFRIMNYVFVTGNEYKFRAIDLSLSEVIQDHIETAIKWVRSLQVCIIGKSKIYLAAVGGDPDYTSKKSDLFDLSGMVKSLSIQSKIADQKRATNNDLNKIKIQKF